MRGFQFIGHNEHGLIITLNFNFATTNTTSSPSNTSNNRPAVAFSLVLVVSTASFQDGFVNTSTSSNDSNHGAVVGGNYFLSSRRQLNSGLFGLRVVPNDSGVVSRCAGQGASITMLLLNVADDGTFRHSSNREYISNLEGCFLSTVNELTGVHSFNGQEVFFPCLVTVRITEVYYSQRSTSTRVVNNFLDDTFDVAMSFSEILGPELRGSFAVFSVSLEDSTSSFTLSTNNTTHFDLRLRCSG